MRYLIVNADDFGLTRGVNRAICEAHNAGVVRSTTLMANGGSFSDAVEAAKQISGRRLSVGCHVVLLDGMPVLPSSHVISLLAEGRDCFRQGWPGFAIAALCGRIKEDEIEIEARAQIERIQSVGFIVSHVDTHKHAHWFPSVFRPLMRAAKACGVRAIRNPFPCYQLPLSSAIRTRAAGRRSLKMRLLRVFRQEFLDQVGRNGLVTTDGGFGIFENPLNDMISVQSMLARMRDGIWELVCHPGYNDEDLACIRTRLTTSREMERQLLISPELQEALHAHDVRLISFADCT